MNAAFWWAASAAILCGVLYLWTKRTERRAHWTPQGERRDLSPLLAKTALTDADYDLLLHETGLGRLGVDALLSTGKQDTILRMQETLYAPITYRCRRFSPISWTERLTNAKGQVHAGLELVPLEDGDVLISASSHTLGWCNGHAGIVVNAQKGETLESVVIGQKASVCSIEKWREYPTVLVLRLKGASGEERAAIAKDALCRLKGTPYRLAVGVFSRKHWGSRPPKGTQCAHLVWEAFRPFGYDLDSDGGRIVTPHDIAASPLLELVQVYGLDPDKLWR